MRVIKLIHTRPLCCSAPCADRLSFSVFALLKLSAIRCCVGGALHGPAASPRAAVLGALAAADDRAAGRARSLARARGSLSRLLPLEPVGGCGGGASKHEDGDGHTAAPRAPLTARRLGELVGQEAATARASGG